jgi:hypothetical protein
VNQSFKNASYKKKKTIIAVLGTVLCQIPFEAASSSGSDINDYVTIGMLLDSSFMIK